MFVEPFLDRNLVPDFALRTGIRFLLSRRLAEEKEKERASGGTQKARIVTMLKHSPIALSTERANEQHYEVPDEFYRWVLGPHLKYSSGYWPDSARSLAESETAMLDLTCRRAAIEDGDSVLELGCGWGSLTLFMAERFPNSQITAVSNSSTQRQYIEEQAAERGLNNVTIITADMNEFDSEGCVQDFRKSGQTWGDSGGLPPRPPVCPKISDTPDSEQQFDRVVSVEMFEHMRNYETLMRRIAGWLKPDGTLFVHIFSHRSYAYTFESAGSNNWMAENFFTDGLMPSDDLLLHFQDDLVIEEHWNVNGLHYHRTCEGWIENMYAHQDEILRLFAAQYGAEKALSRWVAWKIFFMACSELFRYDQGREWGVSHYLFKKRG